MPLHLSDSPWQARCQRREKQPPVHLQPFLVLAHLLVAGGGGEGMEEQPLRPESPTTGSEQPARPPDGRLAKTMPEAALALVQDSS